VATTNSRSKGQGRYRDPQTFEMTPAMLRVRAPFFWRNTIGLFVVAAIPAGVYYYTWNSLTKDEFGDIPIPPISDAELAKLRREYEEKKRAGNV
jgi:cytochrome c oxidase assembly factor 3